MKFSAIIIFLYGYDISDLVHDKLNTDWYKVLQKSLQDFLVLVASTTSIKKDKLLSCRF